MFNITNCFKRYGYILRIILLLSSLTVLVSPDSESPAASDCEHLLLGQYRCDEPAIDPDTQQAANCSVKRREVLVRCYPVPGLVCGGINHTGTSVGFYQKRKCNPTNGHSFSVALLLSVFLGFLGADRFYLGYPAIGLLKLVTLGFMFIGQLVDVLLIALQVVGPADGSSYVINYYGPGLTAIKATNYTYVKEPWAYCTRAFEQLNCICLSWEAMESLSPACQELKVKYDACFNEWFREKFLKGQTKDDSCAELFKNYQQCVRNALQEKKISWDATMEDVLGTAKEKNMKPDNSKQ